MKLPRFFDWIVAAVLLFALIWWIRTPSVNDWLVGVRQPDNTIKGGFVPVDVIVLVYQASRTTLGVIAGYWCDRSAFPDGRPDHIVNLAGPEPWTLGEAMAYSGACIRRGLIIVGLAAVFGANL